MDYTIAIDSCGDLPPEWRKDPQIQSIPLTLTVGDEHIVDDETFDQAYFLRRVAECPTFPRSACPSPETYKKAFEKGDERAYAVTLSAELSGSYNSACLGRNMAVEEDPHRKIHVFNSRSASIGQTLTAMQIRACEAAGMPFEQVVETVERYIDSMTTYFVLDSLDHLRKNGRLTGVKAFVASALKIKPVMGSTPIGGICQLDQGRGINRALARMVDIIIKRTPDSSSRILAIANCNCRERAEQLKKDLLAKARFKDILIMDTAGVSSLYASDGGIIVAV